MNVGCPGYEYSGDSNPSGDSASVDAALGFGVETDVDARSEEPEGSAAGGSAGSGTIVTPVESRRVGLYVLGLLSVLIALIAALRSGDRGSTGAPEAAPAVKTQRETKGNVKRTSGPAMERIRWMRQYASAKAPAEFMERFRGANGHPDTFPAFCDLMDVEWKSMRKAERRELVEAWIAYRHLVASTKVLSPAEHGPLLRFLSERNAHGVLRERPIEPAMRRELNDILLSLFLPGGTDGEL